MVNRNWFHIIVVLALVLVAAQPLFATRGSSHEPEVSPFLRPELEKESVGQDTPSLLAALNHESGMVRWIAAKEMGKRKVAEAIPQLRALLQDVDRVVRAEAAGALLELGDRTGVPVLKTLLDSSIQSDVIRAAGMLAAHGDDSGLDKVRPLLQSPAASDRWSAITVLGASHNPAEAYPALQRGVHDENDTTRDIALNMLKKRATPQAVETVAEMLDSPRSIDRRMATSVLIQVRKVEAIPFIIEALTDEDNEVRLRAALGITYLAGASITPSTEKRVKSIEDAVVVQREWQQWWEQNKATFTLGPPTPPQFTEE